MQTLFHCPNLHDSRILDSDDAVACPACDAPMTVGTFGAPSPYTCGGIADATGIPDDSVTATDLPIPASTPTTSTPTTSAPTTSAPTPRVRRPRVPASGGRMDMTRVRSKTAKAKAAKAATAKRAKAKTRTDTSRTTKAKRAATAKAAARALQRAR
jgi:hypothetical protein